MFEDDSINYENGKGPELLFKNDNILDKDNEKISNIATKRYLEKTRIERKIKKDNDVFNYELSLYERLKIVFNYFNKFNLLKENITLLDVFNINGLTIFQMIYIVTPEVDEALYQWEIDSKDRSKYLIWAKARYLLDNLEKSNFISTHQQKNDITIPAGSDENKIIPLMPNDALQRLQLNLIKKKKFDKKELEAWVKAFKLWFARPNCQYTNINYAVDTFTDNVANGIWTTPRDVPC